MSNNTSKTSLYFGDLLYCLKLSLKLSLIPIALGVVISLITQLVKGNGFTVYDILLKIRNTGFILSCFGMFIGAVGFLMPGRHLRPLDYSDEWSRYFSKFSMVAAITIICVLIIFYVLLLDVAMFAIYT